jgi:hypothetical protein
MATVLRYCLIALWIIFLAVSAYNLAPDWHRGRLDFNWPAYAIIILILLNIAYLIAFKPMPFRSLSHFAKIHLIGVLFN